MTISKRLRYEVMRRDNHTCRYCGASAPEATLTVDHVKPVALGGSDAPDNLVTACVDCNAGKSSTVPNEALVDDVAQDAVRWRRALELAAEETAQKHDQRAEDLDLFYDAWGQAAWMPEDWHTSVSRWLDLGLTIEDLLDLVISTFSRGRNAYWKYFCGAAWGVVRERQARAETILREQERRE